MRNNNTNTRELILSPSALILSALVAILAGAVALVCVQKFLMLAPTYPDFLTGVSTWDASTKIQDTLSYPAFIVGFLAVGGLMLRLFREIPARRTEEFENAFITTLVWWFVPIAIGIGSYYSIYPSTASFTLLIGVAGLSLTILLVMINLRQSEISPQIIGLGILAAIMLGLAPFGIAAIQDRLPIFHDTVRIQLLPIVSKSIFGITVLYLFWVYSKPAGSISRYLNRLILAAQIGIAPFYLLMLPDIYIADTNTPAIQTTAWLWLLSIGFMLVAIGDVVLRYARHGKQVVSAPAGIFRLLSPIALFATIILLRNGQAIIPQVPTDDYHFGENLLGWWSLVEFGKIPYLDFMPPHGIFGDDFGGYLSLLFFDGTAASLVEADRLAATLTMFVAFMALRFYTGSIGIAYFSVLLFGVISRKLFFLFLAPFFCFWLKPYERLAPHRWLLFWVLSSILLILAVPPQGLLAVVSTVPLALWYLYKSGKHGWQRESAVALLCLVIIGLLTPLPAMLRQAIGYVLENGPINQIAYGVPWKASWNGIEQDKARWLFVSTLEWFRMSWIWVPLAAAAIILYFSNKKEKYKYIVRVALPVLIFASLMVPYSMGRIDPSAPSRPGLISNFAWAILLPLLIAPLIGSRGKSILVLGIAFICSGLGIASISKDSLTDLAIKNEVNNLWSGATHGMPNMGTGAVALPHIDRLIRINGYLSTQLAPRETYLDLTGHNADYLYFDRPPAIPITAPYNMASYQQQQRAIEQLALDLPEIALLQAENLDFDGGGMALRTHLIYRFVLNNYNAELHDGYVYGRAKASDQNPLAVSFEVKDWSDVNWDRGINRTESAVIIRDPATIQYLKEGDVVRLPDGQTRRITRVWPQGNAIWLEGPRINSGSLGETRQIDVLLNDLRKQEVSSQLMERVFVLKNLRKLPVAWGRSANSLKSAMKPVADLDFSNSLMHDLVRDGESFRVTGPDPYLWIDLAPLNLTGRSAGLLKFDFFCPDSPEATMQTFWWGDNMTGPGQNESLFFGSTDGSLIVPLDAHPGWVQMKKVAGLRMDLDSAGSCQTFSIKKASLQQRMQVQDKP